MGSVRLVITASYPKTATPLEAAATSDAVSYVLTVTNTGLLQVFDIYVAAWGDGAGITSALTCEDVDGGSMTDEADTEDGQLTLTYESLKIQGLARYPDSGLRGGSSLTCTFSSAVGQTEVHTSMGEKYE